GPTCATTSSWGERKRRSRRREQRAATASLSIGRTGWLGSMIGAPKDRSTGLTRRPKAAPRGWGAIGPTTQDSGWVLSTAPHLVDKGLLWRLRVLSLTDAADLSSP